jgi:serpin B
VYFNDVWLHPFDKEDTKMEYFFLKPNGQNQTQMMHTSAKFAYSSNKNFQAINMPYKNSDLSMVVIMPSVEQFDEFEKTLNAQKIEEIISTLQEQSIDLTFPKFKFETDFSFVEPLVKLGILNAFAPLSANFSGIDGTREIFISNIIQKAYISVDEFGTEAAAATAATMKTTAMKTDSPLVVNIDHPFIFIIRNQKTGTILFIGRLLNPILDKKR